MTGTEADIPINEIICGDCLSEMSKWPDSFIQCVVTSPPYWGLRDYGTATWEGGDAECDHKPPDDAGRTDKPTEGQREHAGRFAGPTCYRCGAKRIDQQLGLEKTPEEYVAKMVEVFREVKRVLRDDGTLWLNLGMSYASSGISANQSRPVTHVPACDSDDIGQSGSQVSDRACPDSCDGHPGGSQDQDSLNSDNTQRTQQLLSSSEQSGRDTLLADCVSTTVADGLPDAPRSTTPSSSHESQQNAPSQCPAAVCPQGLQTSSGGVPVCAGTKACISCTAGTLPSSARHKSDKVLSSSACSDPLCKGDCGICWGYYSIPALKFKHKDEINTPHLVAMALQADGWYLRQTIIYSKPNPMPESCRDRCTKAHEYIFLLTKKSKYFYDAQAIAEPTQCPVHAPRNKMLAGGKTDTGHLQDRLWGNGSRNKRSVWTVKPKAFPEAHFATFPPKLIEPCILAGTSKKGRCPECGGPWERVVEKAKTFESGSGRSGNPISGKQDLSASETNSTPDIRMGPTVSIKTLGWRPTCDCGCEKNYVCEKWEPCIVFDPFAGSGTTCVVAAQLGRDYTGTELNPEYVAMARKRLEAVETGVSVKEADMGQMAMKTLFESEAKE